MKLIIISFYNILFIIRDTVFNHESCGTDTVQSFTCFLSSDFSLQYVHRVLAHELLCPQGGPSCEYYLVLAQTHLLKKDFAKAEEYLQQAAQMDYLVITFAAAATAKSLQSCLTLCNPIDGLLPGSPVPGILQARTLEWVAIFFFNA